MTTRRRPVGAARCAHFRVRDDAASRSIRCSLQRLTFMQIVTLPPPSDIRAAQL
jgi:hypothetical protein